LFGFLFVSFPLLSDRRSEFETRQSTLDLIFGEPSPSEHDALDLPAVGDVGQGVVLQQDKVGSLANLNRTRGIELAQVLEGMGCGCSQGLIRRQADALAIVPDDAQL